MTRARCCFPAGPGRGRASGRHGHPADGRPEAPYPASPPTPGEVCGQEADRLNGTGIGGSADFDRRESRVARVGPEVERVHVLQHPPTGARLCTEPFRNYVAIAPSDAG